jgi:hypothetical protein
MLCLILYKYSLTPCGFLEGPHPNLQEKKPLVSRSGLFAVCRHLCALECRVNFSCVCLGESSMCTLPPQGGENHVCILRPRVPCCHYTSVHAIPCGWAPLHLWLLRLRSIPFRALWKKKHLAPENSRHAAPRQGPVLLHPGAPTLPWGPFAVQRVPNHSLGGSVPLSLHSLDVQSRDKIRKSLDSAYNTENKNNQITVTVIYKVIKKVSNLLG